MTENKKVKPEVTAQESQSMTAMTQEEISFKDPLTFKYHSKDRNYIFKFESNSPVLEILSVLNEVTKGVFDLFNAQVKRAAEEQARVTDSRDNVSKVSDSKDNVSSISDTKEKAPEKTEDIVTDASSVAS